MDWRIVEDDPSRGLFSDSWAFDCDLISRKEPMLNATRAIQVLDLSVFDLSDLGSSSPRKTSRSKFLTSLSTRSNRYVAHWWILLRIINSISWLGVSVLICKTDFLREWFLQFIDSIIYSHTKWFVWLDSSTRSKWCVWLDSLAKQKWFCSARYKDSSTRLNWFLGWNAFFVDIFGFFWKSFNWFVFRLEWFRVFGYCLISFSQSCLGWSVGCLEWFHSNFAWLLLDFILTILVTAWRLLLISIQTIGMICLLAVGMIIVSNDQLGWPAHRKWHHCWDLFSSDDFVLEWSQYCCDGLLDLGMKAGLLYFNLSSVLLCWLLL